MTAPSTDLQRLNLTRAELACDRARLELIRAAADAVAVASPRARQRWVEAAQAYAIRAAELAKAVASAVDRKAGPGGRPG